MNLILLYLSFISYISHCADIIKVQLSRNSGHIEVKLSFGEPPQLLYIPIDIRNHFTWINPFIYNKESSRTVTLIQEDALTINNKVVTSMLLEDNINFPINDITLKQFLFFYVKYKESTSSNGAIGLSYKVTSPKISFVHQLYEKRLIPKKAFGLYYSPEKEKGFLYIGGFPLEITSKFPYTTACDVNNGSQQWGCKLDFSFSSKDRYNIIMISSIVYFTSTEYYTYIPREYMTYLNKTIFDSYYKNKQCSYIDYIDKAGISCDCNSLDDFPDIYFVIGNTHFRFSKENLFFQFDTACTFLMRYNKESNDWMFGDSFLLRYPVQFSYADHEIRFYSESNFEYKEKVTKNSNNSVRYVYTLIIVMLLVSIIFLYVIKKNNIL